MLLGLTEVLLSFVYALSSSLKTLRPLRKALHSYMNVVRFGRNVARYRIIVV